MLCLTLNASRVPGGADALVALVGVEADRAVGTVVDGAVVVASDRGDIHAVTHVAGAEAPVLALVDHAAVLEQVERPALVTAHAVPDLGRVGVGCAQGAFGRLADTARRAVVHVQARVAADFVRAQYVYVRVDYGLGLSEARS